MRGRRAAVVRWAAASLALAAAGAQPASPSLVFVSNEGSRTVSVVDVAARRVVATIPVGERPRGIQTSPDGRRVLVALSDDRPNEASGRDAIAEIDVATRRVVARASSSSATTMRGSSNYPPMRRSGHPMPHGRGSTIR